MTGPLGYSREGKCSNALTFSYTSSEESTVRDHVDSGVVKGAGGELIEEALTIS